MVESDWWDVSGIRSCSDPIVAILLVLILFITSEPILGLVFAFRQLRYNDHAVGVQRNYVGLFRPSGVPIGLHVGNRNQPTYNLTEVPYTSMGFYYLARSD